MSRLPRPLLLAVVGGLTVVSAVTSCDQVLGIGGLPDDGEPGFDAGSDASISTDGAASSADSGDAADTGDAGTGSGETDGDAAPLADAALPLSTLTQFLELEPPDAAEGAMFGMSLAFSLDGEWLAIGAPQLPGAVYLYKYDRQTSEWLASDLFTEGQFIATPSANDAFGTAVAFSENTGAGLTLAMSAPGAASGRGAVFRASLPANAVTFAPVTGAITSPLDGGGFGFGDTLGYGPLKGDVLSVSASANPGYPGLVYEYGTGDPPSDGGVLEGDQNGDGYGSTLASTDDYEEFVIGSPQRSSGTGQLLLGNLSGDQQKIISPNAGTGALFGSAAAFSRGATTPHFLFVGEPNTPDPMKATFVYAYDFETTVTGSGTLLASIRAPQDSVAFGAALAVSATSLVAVGAPGTAATQVNGDVFVYPLPDSNSAQPYAPAASILPAPPALQSRALFGHSLAFAMQPTGPAAAVLAVSAPGLDMGHVYLYR